MSPGTTQHPRASMRRATSNERNALGVATARTRPPSSKRSRGSSIAPAGSISLPPSIAIHAQHHDDVDTGEAAPQIVMNRGAEALELVGQERRRADEAHARTERREAVEVRASHAAVQDVADDCDLETGDSSLLLTDRE